MRKPKPTAQKLYDGDDSKTTTQWRYYLKKSIANVASDLLRVDHDKSYQIDIGQLMKIIDKRV